MEVNGVILGTVCLDEIKGRKEDSQFQRVLPGSAFCPSYVKFSIMTSMLKTLRILTG